MALHRGVHSEVETDGVVREYCYSANTKSDKAIATMVFLFGLSIISAGHPCFGAGPRFPEAGKT